MLGEALQRLERQVEAVEARILALEPRHDLEALGVVVEAAVGRHGRGQRPLAGMAERRMAEIVGQRQRLGEILVEAQQAGDGAGDLRHLQGVGEARAVVVALVEHEHLRLVGEAPEGGGMHDAVAVALEGRAHGAGGLGMDAAGAVLGHGWPRPQAAARSAARRAVVRGFACRAALAVHGGVPMPRSRFDNAAAFLSVRVRNRAAPS